MREFTRGQVASVLLTTILLVVTIPQFVSITGISQIQIVTDDVTMDNPIVILSNDDFVSQGWAGQGTYDDPYVIENLEIRTVDSCITIKYTTNRFVIRGCTLSVTDRDEGGDYHSTIALVDVANGRIVDCDITTCGIYIAESTNCVVQDNVIRECDSGVTVMDSTRCVIRENSVFDGFIGISIVRGLSHDVVQNQVYGHVYDGIVVTSSSRAGGFTPHPEPSNITVRENVVYNNCNNEFSYAGINVLYSDTVYIHDNYIGWNYVRNTRETECTYAHWRGNFYSDYTGSNYGFDSESKLWSYDSNPQIDHPDDKQFSWGASESIHWTPEDSLPSKYVIFVDAAQMDEGYWDDSGVTYDLGHLYPGTYNILIVVHNAAGATVSDNILVKVDPQPHNLRWSVSENTTLQYSFMTSKQLESGTTVITDTLEITIHDLPVLPSAIETIPVTTYSWEWVDDEALPSFWYFYEGTDMPILITPAVPSGGWSALTTVIDEWQSTFPEEFSCYIISDLIRWGVRLVLVVDDVTIELQTTWYREDGTLERAYLRGYNPETGEVVTDIVRSNPPVLSTIIPILLLSVTSIAIILSVSVFRKKEIEVSVRESLTIEEWPDTELLRLTCPHCGEIADYDTKVAKMYRGVRCKKCSHRFDLSSESDE
ncbi:MAG: NosD domain-containing protein [Candidatus Thorarchaeota archaeon]